MIGKYYVYAVVDKLTEALVKVELTRQLARVDVDDAVKVRRAKLVLFDS